MLDTNQFAHVERSIRFLEQRVSADVVDLRKELSALRTAQWRAESRAERHLLAAVFGVLNLAVLVAIIVAATLR